MPKSTPTPPARTAIPLPPPLPPNYLGKTQFGGHVAALLGCANAADRARHEHALKLKKWQKTAQPEDLNRRLRLRRQFEKREAKGFILPATGGGLPFKRAGLVIMKRQLRTLLEINQQCATTGAVSFMGGLRALGHAIVPDVRAILRGACPTTWKSATGTFDVAGGAAMTEVQRQEVVVMAKMLLTGNVPDIRHDALTCLKILEGQGTLGQRIAAVQSSAWHFEVEDVFLAITTAKGGKVWHPILHLFFEEERTAETVRRVKEGMRVKSGKTEFLEPELVMGEGILTEEQTWKQAFSDTVNREIHDGDTRKAARLIMEETTEMTELELKALRGALRSTEFQDLSNNSAWCRALFGQEQSAVTLDFPENLEEYEMVSVVATCINSPLVQEVGITSLISKVIKGEGKRADQHPDRVTVQELKLQRGAQSPL